MSEQSPFGADTLRISFTQEPTQAPARSVMARMRRPGEAAQQPARPAEDDDDDAAARD